MGSLLWRSRRRTRHDRCPPGIQCGGAHSVLGHDPQRSASASLADSHFRHLPPVLVWNSGFVAPIPPYAGGMRLVGLPLETSPTHVGLEATDAGVAPGFAGYGFLRLGVRSGGVAALPLAGDWLDSEARG